MTPPPNPFIELARHPLAALTALAYVFAYAGVALWLGGLAWELLTDLRNYVTHRGTGQKYGPAWAYVPPRTVYLRAGAVCLLAAVLLLLTLAIGWLVFGGWLELA